MSSIHETSGQTSETLLHTKLQEKPFRDLVAEIKDYAVILLDTSGKILTWNVGAEVIKGYKADEIIGRNFEIFYPESDRRNGLPAELLAEASEHGRALHEGWRLRKDGTSFWGSVVITALHDSSDAIIGYSKLTRDLTEKRQADEQLSALLQELAEKNTALEKLNEQMSSFAAHVSHDLKEPLRKITVYISKLRSMLTLSDDAVKNFDRITDGASRMGNLINNLLLLSQVSAREISLEQVNLNSVVQSVTGDIELLIREKKATIQVGSLPVITGIAVQWHQVFLNLISNSLKYSRPGVPPVISISSSLLRGPSTNQLPNKEYHRIELEDNGLGFDNEDRERIFQIFERLPETNHLGGTGLGLAIVKQVIDNHRGSITAEGFQNKGSRFTITVPVD